MWCRQENRKGDLVKSLRSTDVCERWNGVGGLLLRVRDNVTRSAPALGNPFPVYGIGRSTDIGTPDKH
jgi:hypothetical protein